MVSGFTAYVAAAGVTCNWALLSAVTSGINASTYLGACSVGASLQASFNDPNTGPTHASFAVLQAVVVAAAIRNASASLQNASAITVSPGWFVAAPRSGPPDWYFYAEVAAGFLALALGVGLGVGVPCCCCAAYHHRRARREWRDAYALAMKHIHGEQSAQHIAAAKAAAEAAGIFAKNAVHIEPLQHTGTIARWRNEAVDKAMAHAEAAASTHGEGAGEPAAAAQRWHAATAGAADPEAPQLPEQRADRE